MVALTGLGSGLDTNSIIAQLVALERQRITQVQTRATAQSNALTAYGTLRAKLTELRAAAQSLVKGTDWNLLTATSSDDDAVGVTATSGTFTGSMAFRVTALATSGAVRSANTITGLSTRVTTGSAIFVAAGGKQFGFSALTADDTVTTGSHSIVITQSSGGAKKVGAAALAASTVIDGSNNSLQLTVNGASATVNIAAGTYDRQQLATALQAALDAQGVGVTASVDSANMLQLATTSEGSAATLRITGGTAIAPLVLTTDASDNVGVDGKLTVDGGAVQTFGNVTALSAGTSVTIAAGAGNITGVISGGLRTGTLTGNQVNVGDGSLSSVVAAINSAKSGVTAAAVQVGTNIYRLQISSTTSGANGDPNIGLAEFDSAVVGSMTTLAQGADAQITVGSGAGQYTVTNSSNTISNLLPGLSLTLKQVTTSDVTVTLDRNADGLADKVQKIVDAANALRTEIDKATAYDASTKKASALTGDSTTRRLVSEINAAISAAVPGATPGSPGLAGVSVGKDGKFVFDRTKFIDAFRDDPTGMSKVFAQGATSTNGSVSLVSAGDRAIAGVYAMNITAAAEQATLLSSGLPGVGTTIRAKIGTLEGSYTVQSGDTLATAVAGLNTAFAAVGLGSNAVVAGANIRITASTYGSGTQLSVAWDGTNFVNDSGVDVAGTIGGVAGTGIGQQLTIPATDNTIGGISILYSGATTGAIGTLTYTPGLAQRTSSIANKATDSISGYLTSAENARKSQRDLINKQVESMEQRLTAYEDRLKRQFASLETALSNLKSQQSWLTGQISQLA
jgi:flagellar hook-associated protein 2